MVLGMCQMILEGVSRSCECMIGWSWEGVRRSWEGVRWSQEGVRWQCREKSATVQPMVAGKYPKVRTVILNTQEMCFPYILFSKENQG